MSRPSRILLTALIAVCLVCGIGASAVTGPAFEEVRFLSAVEAAKPLVRQIADSGPGALLSAEGQHLLSRLGTGSPLFVLLGAWSSLSLGRIGAVDEITAARLPLLILTSFGPVALFFLLRRPWGERTATLSALVLLCMPRWLHGVAVTSMPVFLTSVGLIAAAFAQGTLRGSRRGLHALLVAGTFALGAAHSLAVLWLVLALVIAHWLRHVRRGPVPARRGFAAAPPWLLLSLAAIPIGMIAFNPALWKAGSVGIARFVLAPIAIHAAPTWYLGSVVQAPPTPVAYPAVWLALTTPLTVLLSIGIAPMLLWRRRPSSGFRSGSLPELLALAALGLGSAALPALLSAYPPLSVLGLPLLSLAFVWTLVTLDGQLGRFGRMASSTVIAITLLPGLLEISTASAGFGLISGGGAGVWQRKTLAVGDGSELAAIAPALDAQGRGQITLAAPASVPRNYFQLLDGAARIKTGVVLREPGPGADAELSAGPGPAGVAAVGRDGAVLWRLDVH